MDLRLSSKNVAITPDTYRDVIVELGNVNESDILEHFKVEDILDYFTYQEFLDKIGIDKVMEYFDLQEKE